MLRTWFPHTLALVALANLTGCATQPASFADCSGRATQPAPADFKCTSGATISRAEALQIALEARAIADQPGYTLFVDRDDLAYFVSSKAADGSRNPLFGTVVIDSCGNIITTTGRK